MTRNGKVRIPKLVHHKPTNRARVRINGRDIWCGKWPRGKKSPSPEAEEKYRRIIAEYLATGNAAVNASGPPPRDDSGGLSVSELLVLYWRFARSYYTKDGRPTGQIPVVRSALRSLRLLYGSTAAAEFGPRKLKLVREAIVRDGRCRGTVNTYVACIRRAFRWAVSEELIPPAVHEGLRSLPGLRKGRSVARESEPVRPVGDGTVNDTLPHLPPAVAAMVRLQLLTGMRPGEVVGIRPCDVTIGTDGIWCYRPQSHKMEHHERERRIFIGPKGQDVLRPFLDRDHDAFCFSPAKSEAERNASRREGRRTPLTPSQRARRRKARRRRPPQDRYTKDSYRRAVARGCEAAFGMPESLRNIDAALRDAEEAQRPVERERLRAAAREWRARHVWSPNQLRHSGATLIRERYGVEAASVVLGHSDPRVTEIYAERDFAMAARVMKEIG